MGKLDLKKEFKQLFSAKVGKPSIVDVPKLNFLMVDGQGNPNTAQAFKDAVGALYGVSYTLKFKYKKEKAQDYGVPPLQGLWWADDMESFAKGDKDSWYWTMMIMQPEFVSRQDVMAAIEAVKKKTEIVRFPKVRFEAFREGPSAQVMHIGPYSAEGPTIKLLHDFIEENGYKRSGKHHEIYLGDPRKSAPEKLKTIVRQPVMK